MTVMFLSRDLNVQNIAYFPIILSILDRSKAHVFLTDCYILVPSFKCPNYSIFSNCTIHFRLTQRDVYLNGCNVLVLSLECPKHSVFSDYTIDFR